MKYTFALCGNPNVGKTSLYNRLTRSSEHVGNWHGVTVDKVVKRRRFEDNEIIIKDLPGLYSLTVYSFEEAISRDDVMSGQNDLIVCVCDANNLSRNLYLVLQLLELGLPVLVAVNMIDELNNRGLSLDVDKLNKRLGVPVIKISAVHGFNPDAFLFAAISAADSYKKRRDKIKLPYLKNLPLGKVLNIVGKDVSKSNLSSDYVAVKILEKDEFVFNKLDLDAGAKAKIESLKDFRQDVARVRYEYIDAVTDGVLVHDVKRGKRKLNFIIAEKADKFILNKYLALPIFILIMSVIFWITFGSVGKFFTDILDLGKDKLIELVGGWLQPVASPVLKDLITNGIINGVGGVIVFLPQIVILFVFLALLEDSGYISRLAFMTDGMFRRIGLSGRAVFTMLMGLGCSATAVLTSRGLENDLMRKKTVLLTPFMSCSARLPVYTAIAGAFFTDGSVPIILGLYLLGAFTVVFIAALMEGTRLKSGEASFIMEMPRYRLPTFERVMQIIKTNTKTFIVKVGSVVFTFNVIVWLLCSFSFTEGYVQVGAGLSIMEKIGGFLAPLFSPLGFGNWRAITALLSGFVAKEMVISTISSLGGVEAVLPDSLAAICFLVYTLLYVPCVATLGSIRKEAGFKWMMAGLIMQLLVAYIAAFSVRMVCLAFAEGVINGIIAVSSVASTLGTVFMLSRSRKNRRPCFRCNGAYGLKHEV